MNTDSDRSPSTVKTAFIWAAVVGVPTLTMWLVFPPRPGDDNDVPDLWAWMLIVLWGVATGVAVYNLTRKTTRR